MRGVEGRAALRVRVFVCAFAFGLLLASGGSVALGARGQAGRDTRPPRIVFYTPLGERFVSLAGLPRDPIRVQGEQIEGGIRDDRSAIDKRSLKVTFAACGWTSYSPRRERRRCEPGMGVPPVDPGPNGLFCSTPCAMPAEIRCGYANDCGFEVVPPVYPGVYEVRVEVADVARNKAIAGGLVILVI